MKVLLLGSGGREHALALALSRSASLTQLFILPGNDGMAREGQLVSGIALADHAAILDLCRTEAIDLVVVGPEAPLVAGLADDLAAAGFAVFGPSKAAAQLEGSKDFTKSVCVAAGIPTAAYATFTDHAGALAYLREKGAPIVVKYDGLMAGKGVTVAASLAEAEEAIAALYANEPAAKVVIEEMMEGEEASFFCLIDGETVVPFGSAQDHKRVFDGDKGPNTGGMGAYSPAPVFTGALEAETLARIILPTAREMVRRGMPYRGVLFAGLMLTSEGPKLIEYNCRFGDPECQALMLRFEGDLVQVLHAAATGALDRVSVTLAASHAVGVVMAARGYPGDYAKGSVIRGLDKAGTLPGVTIFHAGTKAVGGEVTSHGGRVLTVAATGTTLREARDRAYAAVDAIDWPEGFCRRDIAARGLARLGQG
ncbi:phosphoribosylamine--glycine ligase [Rhabdaerophilum sp. SD176]|uniref:phosphoribosylamine--glycine ligase n=1 Tax=Rhabdaerophilum sp. SD176 TaxID=2983548 RepID=UPI0024DFF63D|nr:phosphoribosylamine--glycine ligase [Rhabdaerophilum sp. SD176]